ncbi:MAG: DoxX family membrane protein [Proteobacteria bacterium]|nr:DoxX family membrane protein [Pseudomonadota bacterium]
MLSARSLAVPDSRLAAVLLALRLSLGAFLFQWGLEKLVAPNLSAAIGKRFYSVDLSGAVITATGVAELALSAALLLGLWRRPTYAIATVIHLVSVLVSWQQLLDPFKQGNHLFAASVPVLVGFVALYVLRDRDRYSIDGMRGASSA